MVMSLWTITCIGQLLAKKMAKDSCMNKIFYSEFYAESWHFQEWCKLHGVDCKNIKVQDSVIESINKRHQGPAVYFLKPKTIFRLASEIQKIDAVKFLLDKQLVCGSGWHDTHKPYQNDILYFFESNFDQWKKLSTVFTNKILLLADGIPSTRLMDLGVFEFMNFHMEFLYYANTYLETILVRKPSKDFLYLIMDKGQRSHRDLLYFLLKDDKEFDNSVCERNTRNNRQVFKDLVDSYGKALYELDHNWYDRFPSIKFYSDTNFEIVGETFGELGNDAFFPTEKIVKPITMKHPFVVAGSKGYLRNLRTLGFKTFADHIDESYDLIHDWQDRTKAVVEVVRSIIRKGSLKFYNETKSIREHNYNVLCDMQGRQKNILWNNMKKVMEKINEG